MRSKRCLRLAPTLKSDPRTPRGTGGWCRAVRFAQRLRSHALKTLGSADDIGKSQRSHMIGRARVWRSCWVVGDVVTLRRQGYGVLAATLDPRRPQ